MARQVARRYSKGWHKSWKWSFRASLRAWRWSCAFLILVASIVIIASLLQPDHRHDLGISQPAKDQLEADLKDQVWRVALLVGQSIGIIMD